MAIMQVNFSSSALSRTVTMNVILPTDGEPYESARPVEPIKTLYLLHGYYGNCSDWVNYTRVQQWAENKNLAVVMPSGENSFYVDTPYAKFGEFTGKELVCATRRMFPLSHRREDTFIAGLSMGGFGALRNGLKYYENFGCIASFSGAMHMFEETIEDARRQGFEACLGDIEKAAASDMNPRVALLDLKAKIAVDPTITLPRIFMSCGTEDSLIHVNRLYRDILLSSGVDLTYEEAPGAHTWEFWNAYLQRLLDWLPL